jgi:hypothetical protein
MEKEFVPYTEALELKELGFNEPCLGYYDCERDFMLVQGKLNFLTCEVARPLYQQAFRWFRDEHKLFPDFHKNELNGNYRCDFIKNTETYEVLYDSMDYNFNIEFATYEEAEQACLKKLIEIVKKK